MKIFKNYFLITFFLIFLLFLGSFSHMNTHFMAKNNKNYETNNLSLFEKDKILKEKNKAKEDDFSENFFGKLFFVEHYGQLQKILGKKIVDDPVPFRRVYKGSDDMLYYIVPNKNIYTNTLENIESLKEFLDKHKIKFSFILTPNKHSINSKYFPYGVMDYSNTNTNDLYTELKDIGINTLNLNSEYYKEHFDDKDCFYLTDTHWKNETAFWGYQKTLEFLSETQNFKFENKNNSNDLNNYSIEKFNDTYIGSMGKRAGRLYLNKKDDYSLILPSFETNYTYKKYDDHLNLISEKSGSFEKVFVNRDVLKSDDPYIDKYTTMMGYGSAYEIITNNNIDNNSSVMIVKDSFAMPLAAYLSTNVHSVYLVDTRTEAMRKRLENTISTVKPDQVLFIFSPNTVFYYPDMFNFKN